MLKGRLADSEHLSIPISHNFVLQATTTACSPGVVCGDRLKWIASVPMPVFGHSLLCFSVIYGFFCCLGNIYDAISYTPLHCSHHEGSTGKCWWQNFHIINKTINKGIVQSWRKHGTVQPSRLNCPLSSPTTDPINITQASESTFWYRQHFFLTISFTLLPTLRCCRMFHTQEGLKIHLAKNTDHCGTLLSNTIETSVLSSIPGRFSPPLQCITHFNYGTLLCFFLICKVNHVAAGWAANPLTQKSSRSILSAPAAV